MAGNVNNARASCVRDGLAASGKQPGFLMLWQASDIANRLPRALLAGSLQGDIVRPPWEAAAEDCREHFLGYRVAVRLY